MAISVTCSNCGRTLRAKDEYEGKKVKCPGCGTVLLVTGKSVAPFDVFISYSKHDKPVADAACAALENRQLRCWIAPRDILPGDEWGASIIRGIKQVRAMVVIYSSHSNNSTQVKREIERAANRGIPIVPFRIEDIPPTEAMEYFISSHHWMDALTPPLERHLAELAETMGRVLAQPASPGRATDTETATTSPRLPPTERPLKSALEPPSSEIGEPSDVKKSAPAGVSQKQVGIAVGVVLLLLLGPLLFKGSSSKDDKPTAGTATSATLAQPVGGDIDPTLRYAYEAGLHGTVALASGRMAERARDEFGETIELDVSSFEVALELLQVSSELPSRIRAGELHEMSDLEAGMLLIQVYNDIKQRHGQTAYTAAMAGQNLASVLALMAARQTGAEINAQALQRSFVNARVQATNAGFPDGYIAAVQQIEETYDGSQESARRCVELIKELIITFGVG